MSMKLINFQVELLPNKEVIINGRRLDSCRAEVEERTFKKMDLNQQYAILCETQKLFNILLENYNRARVDAKELDEAGYLKAKGKIISAGGGIPGVLKPLPRGKFTGRT
jgi:hypothetical protein